jgi:hypothetical protein
LDVGGEWPESGGIPTGSTASARQGRGEDCQPPVLDSLVGGVELIVTCRLTIKVTAVESINICVDNAIRVVSLD